MTLLLCAVLGNAWGEVGTITFSDLYSSNTTLDGVKIDGTNFSVTFAKGSGNNAPQYYTKGTAVRAYAKNTITVTSTSTISKIELSFGSGEDSNTISANIGSYSNGTWTGSANSVTFTIGGTSGHRRIASIKATTGTALPTPTLTVPEEVEVDMGSTESVSITSNSTGAITFEGYDSSVATIEGSNGSYTITGVYPGTTTITVKQAATSEYSAATATINVTVIDTRSVPELVISPATVEITEEGTETVTISSNSSGAITFEGYNSSVATIEGSNGSYTITGVAPGSTTITVNQAETESYKAATATINVKVNEKGITHPDNELFWESFNNVDGTGGRDGNFNAGSSNPNGKTDETWTVLPTNCGAYQCVKLGTSSASYTLTTRKINITSGTLTFAAAGWNDTKDNTITVTATGATLSGITSVSLTASTWKTYTVNITDGNGEVQLTFTGKRGFLDNIQVLGEKGSLKDPQFSIDDVEVYVNETADLNISKLSDGAITFDPSNNEIAKITSDNKVKGLSAGTFNVTATLAETNVYEGVTVEFTVTVSKKPAVLTIANMKVNENTQTEFSILSTSDGAITFTSSDPSIAEVSVVDGKYYAISHSTTGTATITAVQEATKEYESVTKEFTIEVDEVPVVAGTYYKVTSFDQIVAGKEYILVGQTQNPENTYAMGPHHDNGFSTNYRIATSVPNPTDNKITITNETIVSLTLDGEEDAWTFKASDGFYLKADDTNGSNYLNPSESADDDACKWTITDGFNLKSSKYTNRTIYFNYSQPRFSCYTNGQSKSEACLYVKDPSFHFEIKEQATDGSGNYYATIGSLGEGNYVVSGGVTVSTIKVSSGVIQTVASFVDGEVIPGDGAYLVEGPVGTYNFQKSDDKTEYVFGQYGDNNWLRSTGEGNISDDDMAAPENDGVSGYKYYKLSLRKGKIGFYWGTEGGGAFNYSTPHQAYLVVPLSETPSANANAIYFDGTTGIEAVKDAKTTTGTVHTLSGIRVDGKQLPKGIYIVDGKKIVVK